MALPCNTADIKPEDLYQSAVNVRPIDRDWSEGYGEEWTYVEAPSCPECDETAHYCDTDDLDSDDLTDDQREALERNGGTYGSGGPAWRCQEATCENFGADIDPHERGCDGPMMNYSYELPRDFLMQVDSVEDAAERIAHLPLCIVTRETDDTTYELALTGGGMDLSWGICEAYMLLGFLPPAHFADLPGMADRGPNPAPAPESYTDDARRALWDEWEAKRTARDAAIIAACRATAQRLEEYARNRAHNITRGLNRIEGIEDAPSMSRRLRDAIENARENKGDWLAELESIADEMS